MNATTTKKDYVVHDAQHIRQSLKKANQLNRLQAFGLVLPLVAFLIFAFILPIGNMLFRSVDNQIIINTLPQTIEALESWDDSILPDESVYAILAAEMKTAQRQRLLGKVGTRLNYEKAGMREIGRASVGKEC